MSEPRPRILLVRLSAIGDCIHALPVLAALRKMYPESRLGWAIEDAAHALLRDHPLVDRFHVFPRRAFKKKEGSWRDRIRRLWVFRRELREAGYEIAVDLQGLTKSGLVAWWSGAPLRIGFAGRESRELNGWFMNRRVRVPESATHVVDRNLALLSALGPPAPALAEWILPSFAAERKEMGAWLRSLDEPGLARRVVVLNPGAGWVTKRWPVERFGALARLLSARANLRVIVTWAGAQERADAEAIVRAAVGRRVHLAPDTDLRQLAALLAGADLLVANDTGPLHLAAALGVRTVALFGASDPLRNGPYGSGHRVLTGDPECRPCWKKSCGRGDLACLTEVAPERVLETCLEALGVGAEASAC